MPASCMCAYLHTCLRVCLCVYLSTWLLGFRSNLFACRTRPHLLPFYLGICLNACLIPSQTQSTAILCACLSTLFLKELDPLPLQLSHCLQDFSTRVYSGRCIVAVVSRTVSTEVSQSQIVRCHAQETPVKSVEGIGRI